MPASELSAEERQAIAESLAIHVVKRHLESIAVLFLELNKPLAFLGGQVLLFTAPILGAIFGFDTMQRFALFFQSSENIECLVSRIEALARERQACEPNAHSAPSEGSP